MLFQAQFCVAESSWITLVVTTMRQSTTRRLNYHVNDMKKTKRKNNVGWKNEPLCDCQQRSASLIIKDCFIIKNFICQVGVDMPGGAGSQLIALGAVGGVTTQACPYQILKPVSWFFIVLLFYCFIVFRLFNIYGTCHISPSIIWQQK